LIHYIQSPWSKTSKHQTKCFQTQPQPVSPPTQTTSALPSSALTLQTATPSFLQPTPKHTFPTPPRILIIGAGSRGTTYASAALSCSNATIVGVCEPNEYKRLEFGRKFIWSATGVPQFGQCFTDWREWVKYEEGRRESLKTGTGLTGVGGFAPVIVDAVFVCVLDEMHEEVVCGVAGLGVHVCVEKPLSTSLRSCVNIFRALKSAGEGCEGESKEKVFGICHVLRYSPHNMMLRHLVVDEGVIGDVLSIEHVEPVGWWHFSHSYVR
jgi:predicted dehydrogenase